jgi:hypothetical protein
VGLAGLVRWLFAAAGAATADRAKAQARAPVVIIREVFMGVHVL